MSLISSYTSPSSLHSGYLSNCSSLCLEISSQAGVPNLQSLMPHALRWSRCSNDRNKVHTKKEIKCTIMCLSHSKIILPHHYMEKLSPMKPVPHAKKIGDHWSQASLRFLISFFNRSFLKFNFYLRSIMIRSLIITATCLLYLSPQHTSYPSLSIISSFIYLISPSPKMKSRIMLASF